MTRRLPATLVLLTALCLLTPAAAAQYEGVTATRDPMDDVMGRYNLHPAFEKLGRGLANFFMGWTEIPLNVEKWYSSSDTGGSFFNGLAHGVFRGTIRTGVGFYETLTFFLPYPENFAPILPTLPYFQRTGKRRPLPLE